MTIHLTTSQIKDEAKALVLSHGPEHILEFGTEIVHDRTTFRGEEAERVLAEAIKQAHRVYTFLGYQAPWSSAE